MRRAADDFAGSITDEKLAGHVRAARADPAGGDVNADRVAALVLPEVRKEFALRVARLRREIAAGFKVGGAVAA